MKRIVLASTSPRRRELMGLLGVPFEVANPNVDEAAIRDTSPQLLTALLAEAKAQALENMYPNTIIIGSDTVVALDGAILEKPLNTEHQTQMIDAQKGKRAEVYSSVCLIDTTTGQKILTTKATAYTMPSPTDEEIEAYIATGSGLDKAGGYGQQDENGLFAGTIEGCYTNILGFPLCEVADSLQRLGIDTDSGMKEKVIAVTGKEC